MDKAILMMAFQDLSDFELNENIVELKNLAFACEIDTADVLTQNIKKKSNATYIGSGKVEELKTALDAQDADLVVFNVGLSPSQIRNLEETLQRDVVDKNMLVLEIFSKRAVTPESKAQVEIAQLKYLFPRMIGSYEHLGRQVSGFGTRNKGLGETQLELDRRNVDRRIQNLTRSLKEYEKTRKTTREQRTSSHLPLVSLVGYTNAGKSSLMNLLIQDDEQERHVFVKDMLFASLETFSRKIDLGNNHEFILNDTVGFIKELPHDLIPAFHSTLEEIESSKLLLHVVDVSNPFYETHIKTIEETLDTLDVSDIPVLTIYNKIDLVEDLEAHVNSEAAFISIKENKGIDLLIHEIETILWGNEEVIGFKFPYDKMDLVQQILDIYPMIKKENLDDGVYIEISADPAVRSQYKQYAVDR